jgi:hypothetical protein
MTHRDFTLLVDNILELVEQRLVYYKTYYCEVALPASIFLNGDVMVKCEVLGAVKPYEWIQAQPLTGIRSAVFPKKGDKGILLFMNADLDSPKFLGLPPESMIEKLPTQKKHTLIETPVMKSMLSVDELVGGFLIQSKSPLGSISSPEPTVLGEKLKDLWDFQMEMNNTILKLLDTILGYMMTHIHGTGVGPSSPAMPPIPVNVAKDKVKVSAEQVKITAKKSQYAIPGQLLSPSNKMN